MSNFLHDIKFLGLTDHSRTIATGPTRGRLVSYLVWIGASEREHLWH
jgi:hypothetical protein